MWEPYLKAVGTAFERADKVLGLTGNQEAAACFSFVNSRHLPACPDRVGGGLHVIKKPNDDQIILVPVLPGDEDTPLYKMLVCKNGIATALYRHPCRLLAVNVDLTDNDVLWGIIFLHECFHATKIFADPRLAEVGKIDWGHERDATHFTHTLLNEVYGQRYVCLVNRHVDIMRRVIEGNGGKVGKNFLLRFNYPPELFDIFGPAASQCDFDLKGSLFVDHCQFELIARDRPEDARRRQSELLRYNFTDGKFDGRIISQYGG